jgi:hypothetical protein
LESLGQGVWLANRAIKFLANAARISKTGGFRRLLETADFDLADIYRAHRDFANAEDLRDSRSGGGAQ